MSFVRGAYAIGGHHSRLPWVFLKNATLRVVDRTLGLLGLVLVVATTAACSNTKSSAAGTDAPAAARQVRTVMVTQQPLTRTITVTGTLAAEEQVALSFKVAGRVDQVKVDLGSVVRQGQVLATLVSTDFDLRVRQSEAALIQARARLGLSPDGENDVVDIDNTALVRQRRAVVQEARLNRDRMRTFVERGLSARATLESADAALEVAEGQHQDALEEIRNRQGVLAQRRSELEIARQQLQDTVLRSPLDGAVRERQVSVGEYRAPGTPVLTVVRTHPLRLKLSVPERETVGLQPGLAVRVSVEGDERRHEGRLERIGAAVDEGNRTLPLEAVVPNPGDLLRPGQFATAEIIVSQRDQGLVVPRDTIVTFAGVQKVLTVKDGHAHEQRIRTGRRDGDRVEVVEGLSDGDMVIRAPGNLVDGVAVQVVRAE
jgi:RND family efflux transporter MFP subunit